ncbi:hypothetical protein CO676_24095 [Sinorhizobium sp. BJ1]|nr:hypothetical protein CO676_24095 [Sinorhizobium sp. BJ1]
MIKEWIVSDAEVAGCSCLIEPRQHRRIIPLSCPCYRHEGAEKTPAVTTFDSPHKRFRALQSCRGRGGSDRCRRAQARFGSEIRQLACRIFLNADCGNHAKAEA